VIANIITNDLIERIHYIYSTVVHNRTAHMKRDIVRVANTIYDIMQMIMILLSLCDVCRRRRRIVIVQIIF